MPATDADLVALARAGDRAAYGLLVERHRVLALRLANRLLRYPADAEDVVQEACLQAFLGLDRLREAERFGAWLCGIALNLGRMRLRSRRAVISLEDWAGGRDAHGYDWPEAGPSPEAAYEIVEQHARIVAALDELPSAQRRAVWQFYWDGLSVAEIAALGQVPPGTIKARLSRARQRLRAGLAPAPAKETGRMIQVTVNTVMARMAPDTASLATLGDRPRVVVLRTLDGERVLCIFIGPAEGDAIGLQLAGLSLPRPMTFDYFARLLQASGAAVERVAITRLAEDVFYGATWLRTASGDVQQVDARPSDALTLALRLKVPIYVDEAVLDAEGQSAAGLADWLSQLPPHSPADSPRAVAEGEAWRPVVDLVGPTYNPRPRPA